MKNYFNVLLLILIITSSCEIENIEYIEPIVFSYPPENVLTNSASLGGEVASEGGKLVSEYGVVISTSDSPTINDIKIIEGERLGVFYNNYTFFEANTTYFFRAFATNSKGTGYGEQYSFTTGNEPLCSPSQENFVDTGLIPLTINNVELSHPSYGFDEGNVEYATFSNSSVARIFVQFNEIDQNHPQNGEYEVVSGEFDGNTHLSEGKAKLYISNFSGIGGGVADAGTNFFVENDGTKVTIIFCDTPVGQYTLNGKFSYQY